MIGIHSYGAYIPHYRLERRKIFEAMGWLNSATIALSKGEKAVANYDEDSITMAVAACRNASCNIDRRDLAGLYFGSTTMSFQERQNSGIIAAALGMRENVRAADFSGSLKSGTTALISALEAVGSGGMKNMLVCASDCRLGKMGSSQEMTFGDAAASFVIGEQDIVAEYKGSYSITADFGDHVRGKHAIFDQQWEDRWIRDQGFENLIPKTVDGLLNKYNLEIEQFSKVVYACYYPAARKKINKILGINPDAEQNFLMDTIGEMGTAQSLVMFAKALENSHPGDKLLLVSFGSGCDALYFEVTEEIEKFDVKKKVSWYLENKDALDNYEKYLAWRNIIPIEKGIRGEEDSMTRWSIMARASKAVLGLCGTKCKQCGTPQYPPQRICVNPSCGAADEMEDYYFSEKTAEIVSFTGDNLAASINPPLTYGNVIIDGGGRMMVQFADCDLSCLHVGMKVSFSFRIKYYDERRDVTRYFWKAVPIKEGK